MNQDYKMYKELADWEQERIAVHSKGRESRSFKAKIAVRERLRLAADVARSKYIDYSDDIRDVCPHEPQYLTKSESSYEDDWSKQGTTTTTIRCSRCDQTVHREERHYSW